MAEKFVTRDLKDSARRGILPLTGLLVLWALAIWIYNGALAAQDKKDHACRAPNEVVTPSAVSTPVPVGGTASERLELHFLQSRGVERDQVAVTTTSELPSELAVRASALTSPNETISADHVHAKATSSRGALILDVCVGASELGRISSGTYDGTITVVDPRTEPFSLPITMTIQARYLWWLAPLVVLLPLGALYVVWGLTSSANRPPFDVGLVRSLVAGIGATALVFGAQGIANKGWGGPQAAFGLVAAMYAAATGVVATISNPGRTGGNPTGREPQRRVQ